MTDTLLILAGGASSRMKKPSDVTLSAKWQKQANTESKALIQVNGRPMLDYILYNAKKAGITKIIIIIGPQGDSFKAYYGAKMFNNDFHGLSISYAIQNIPEHRSKPLGTADAVFQALEQYPTLQKTRFLVCNADNLYSTAVFRDLRKLSHNNALIAYDRDQLDFPMTRIAQFALLTIDQNDFLRAIIEKPALDDLEKYKGPDGRFRVSMNIFKLDGNDCFRYLRDCPLHPIRQEKELPAVLTAMIKDTPRSVKAVYKAEHVPDLTAKDDILTMNDYLSRHIGTLNWS